MNCNRYVGTVQTEWLEDGRRMKLLQTLQYIDPACNVWEATKESIVDGASIPKFAWSIIGGPFEGKYRNASVIHDVACDQKTKPWEAVHEVFYNAMIASGVSIVTAKIMYAAVFHFGPRWPQTVTAVVRNREVNFDIASDSEDAPRRASRQTSDSGWIRDVQDSDGGASQPDESLVTVTIDPPPPSIAPNDFEQLRRAIEQGGPDAAESMTLEEIRSFQP
ncbi:MAG: hypothetical protein QOC81_2880 [Thermoanaerobaculia bacterium]|jgi:hypothetical protein|nr:hypothetical protein [Thermoanaerobaculia bacterium]